MKYLAFALTGAVVLGVPWMIDFVRVEGVLSLQLELLVVHLVLGAIAGVLVVFCRKRPRVAAVTGGAIVLAMAMRAVLPANVENPDRPVSVLIVVADSDVIELRAREGALFRHAVTPIAQAFPTWVSTVTGMEPRTHGIRHRFPSSEILRDVGPTLFTKLRDEGYFTFVTSGHGGAFFSSFEAGFELVDTPERSVDAEARANTLQGHRLSSPLLRFDLFRAMFPSWRNIPSRADPQWVVDRVLDDLGRTRDRPFAGLVFLGTANDDVLDRLLNHLRDTNTLVVVTDNPVDSETLSSLSVPILLLGPRVPQGIVSDLQVRHYDLAATVLDLIDEGDEATTFGDGITLFEQNALRPICVETGLWLSPGPDRLDYPGLSDLLELEPTSREMVLRYEWEPLVETAKERGIVLGHRLYREQLTPRGFKSEIVKLTGIEPSGKDVDLAQLFDERCVEGDASLSRLHGAVVFEMTP